MQHSKLLAQFVFTVFAFHFNTRTKTRAPLPDCRLNNTLIQFVPSCQDTRTQFVDVLDPPFVDLLLHALGYWPHLQSTGFKSGLFGGQSVGGIKSGVSLVNRSTVSRVASPMGGLTVLLQRGKLWQLTNTWQKCLHQDFLVVMTVDFDSRLDEMDAGCSDTKTMQT